jgi:type IV secretory pathway protease TraF
LPSNIPLIKTVWAVEGEQVCHSNGVVEVAHRPALVVLSHDSQGRSLPSQDGCYTLAKDEVFLVSTDVQTSFDSRYFGPVTVSDILGPLQYLGRFQRMSRGRAERRKAGRG